MHYLNGKLSLYLKKTVHNRQLHYCHLHKCSFLLKVNLLWVGATHCVHYVAKDSSVICLH